MFRNFFENLRKFDWVLIIAVFLLFSLGLAAIYSVDLSRDDSASNFNKQIIFGVIGFVLLIAFGLINYSAYWVHGKAIYITVLSLLLLVLFLGTTLRGTRGWFVFGGLGFQPVEIAKIGLIIVLAKFFSNRFQQFFVAKHIIVSFVLTLFLMIPVLMQPDLGSASIMLGIWFVLLLIIGLQRKYMIMLLVALLIFVTIAWSFVLQDYQKDRITSFLNPTADPLGAGYNVSQSIIAIGSGYIWGRGLGFGSQSQLKFIPESQTDFIFAVIAEELGLFGVLLVLGFWGVIFYRLIIIAKKARNDFGLFIALGIASLFSLHMLINIGMNMGVMPVTGISLPFLSYGGSFLLVSLIMIGIAESVAVHR
jgi:rod shape determining protein RodA